MTERKQYSDQQLMEIFFIFPGTDNAVSQFLDVGLSVLEITMKPKCCTSKETIIQLLPSETHFTSQTSPQ